MYYLGSGGVIEERYSKAYGNLISSLPSTFTIPYDYNDADRKAIFITLDLTFTDDKKFYNTDYRLQFNTSAACHAYSYIFNLADTYKNGLISSDIILSQTALVFNTAYMSRDVGDVYRYPVTMNNDIVNHLNSKFGSDFTDNITICNVSTSSTNKFTCDFHIPQNQTMLYYPKLSGNFELVDAIPAPRTIRICLYLYQSSGTQTSLKISDLTLIPINGTEQYYRDEIFHDDVIGSDEPGEESGLKGIIAYLKNLPSNILEIIKDLFIPSNDFFEETFNEIDLFLSDHFGFLYQILDFIIEIVQFLYDKLSSLSELLPSECYLYFPSGNIYLSSDPPEGQSFIMSDFATGYDTALEGDLSSYVMIPLIPDNSEPGQPEGYYIRFDFLNKNPYAFLYSFYVPLSYFILTVLYIYHWYNRARMVMR